MSAKLRKADTRMCRGCRKRFPLHQIRNYSLMQGAHYRCRQCPPPRAATFSEHPDVSRARQELARGAADPPELPLELRADGPMPV